VVVLACQRPVVLASLRSSDDGRGRLQRRYPPINRRPCAGQQSVDARRPKPAQLGNSPARTSTHQPCSRAASFVRAADVPRAVQANTGSESPATGLQPSSSQLGGRNHQSLDQCDDDDDDDYWRWRCSLCRRPCTKTPPLAVILTSSHAAWQSSSSPARRTNNCIHLCTGTCSRSNRRRTLQCRASPNLTRRQRETCLRRVTHTHTDRQTGR